MVEQKQILTLLVVTFIIGVAGIAGVYLYRSLGQSSDVVETYTATLHPNGQLDETYVYKLTSKDTAMLYRNWDDPLSFGPVVGQGYIAPLSIDAPAGTIAYIKDHYGQVTVMSASADDYAISEIARLAYSNEAGCYGAQDFPPGTYTISYVFTSYLPIEHDSGYEHFNLQLARIHIPYRNVNIIIADAGYVEEIYPHPPSMNMRREGNQIIITGSAAENELVEVEMLMKRGAHQIQTGFASEVPNVEGLTRSANSRYSLMYNGSVWLGYAGMLIALAAPLVLFGFYNRYGKEDDVTVPEYLSFVPNTDRKPWLVNLIFRKNVGDFDENGFYSTLLDLHTKKKIRIEQKEGGMRIFLLDTSTDSAYEQKVLEFLGKLAIKDATLPNPQTVFDTDTLKELANSINSGKSNSLAVIAQNDLQSLTTRKIFNWVKMVDDFITQGRNHVWPLAALGMLIGAASIILLILEPYVGSQIFTPILLGLVIIIQTAVVFAFPSTLYGRWKPGLYKEKLSWDAFRAHLSDLSQMKKYSTEDLSMWGSWLVYGTALGVGDKVAEAMKELKINIDVASVAPIMRSHFYPIRVASAPVSRGSGGGGHRGGGGRMGGGGGRGGGGGGRRGR